MTSLLVRTVVPEQEGIDIAPALTVSGSHFGTVGNYQNKWVFYLGFIKIFLVPFRKLFLLCFGFVPHRLVRKCLSCIYVETFL